MTSLTPVLTTRNAEAAATFYRDAFGAVEIFPIADQPYGLRQGRFEDPYGHHWLIGRPLRA